jgi:hypothetical protein
MVTFVIAVLKNKFLKNISSCDFKNKFLKNIDLIKNNMR